MFAITWNFSLLATYKKIEPKLIIHIICYNFDGPCIIKYFLCVGCGRGTDNIHKSVKHFHYASVKNKKLTKSFSLFHNKQSVLVNGQSADIKMMKAMIKMPQNT